MKHDHSHDHGLAHDLQTLIRTAPDRRRALRWLGAGGAMALPLLGCGGGDAATTAAASSTGSTTNTDSSTTTASSTGSSAATTATGTGSSTTTNTTCSTIPSETAGPYPGDGTNSNGSGIANALTLSGIVRSNITSSIAGASATAAGVPLTVRLNLVNTASSCAALSGFAVYLWHCDALGRYSMYSTGVTSENYLRGVQVSDSSGLVTFTTVVPGCYSGRWPHIHFEVYSSIGRATAGGNASKTSQLALPQDVCSAVYATSNYTGSAANLAGVSLSNDNIFSDGSSLQLASVTGSVTAGYVATLQVGVSV